jgi:hypothetical protein
MIIRLLLKPRPKPFQNGIELGAEELDRISLITSVQDANSQQVHVVRHATVEGAAQPIAKHGVGQDLPELVVEDRNQPPCLAVVHGH